MPIYEYICNACGNEFEAMQKFSDKPLTKCACGKSGKVERKLSVPSFHLQGGGWYNEGYSAKKDGSKTEAKTTPKATDSAGAKSETTAVKAETKSTKSETKAAAPA
jgi:putative FmdB family regulatory protein